MTIAILNAIFSVKTPLLIVALTMTALTAHAAEEPFFVAAAEGIYRGAIEPETGKLAPMTLACAVKAPNFLALAPDGKSLYATLDKTVAAFAVGPGDALTPLNEVAAGDAGSCYVSVDESGRAVFVASYGGGYIACLRRKADGSLGAQTAQVPFTGSGPDPVRQKKSYAHSIYPGPGNKFVYACDLGSDHVWIFKFDPVAGTLTAAQPPSASVPPGSGPRHLAFSIDGRFVYASNEMGHSVTAFARDAADGALQPLETVSTLAPGTPPDGITTAEIVCHPSGKWLYVSNRGCETISELSLAADGAPKLVTSVPSPAKFPRQFALDPAGHWMIVAGQKDTRLAVLKIDPATGNLSPTDRTTPANAAMCVLFVPEDK